MNDYVLKGQPEPASNNDTVWAFDLGKGSIGDESNFFTAHRCISTPKKNVGGLSRWKIKKIMGLFHLRGSPVWKSSFALRLAAWLFPTIDTARLVLIRQKISI